MSGRGWHVEAVGRDGRTLYRLTRPCALAAVCAARRRVRRDRRVRWCRVVPLGLSEAAEAMRGLAVGRNGSVMFPLGWRRGGK